MKYLMNFMGQSKLATDMYGFGKNQTINNKRLNVASGLDWELQGFTNSENWEESQKKVKLDPNKKYGIELIEKGDAAHRSELAIYEL